MPFTGSRQSLHHMRHSRPFPATHVSHSLHNFLRPSPNGRPSLPTAAQKTPTTCRRIILDCDSPAFSAPRDSTSSTTTAHLTGRPSQADSGTHSQPSTFRPATKPPQGHIAAGRPVAQDPATQTYAR
ncbi:hypothetical protein HPB48_014832 [Haemaphysalis longicornis]|uniref:Uncharacterized protein n=1 Tax=Haemaphysalis longicornis TaxID=44386 RepID=A0A9J6GEF5_HAELO|nr:hypothetical protein HPB48_014832 [Haemaphysalis longicornis]